MWCDAVRVGYRSRSVIRDTPLSSEGDNDVMVGDVDKEVSGAFLNCASSQIYRPNGSVLDQHLA